MERPGPALIASIVVHAAVVGVVLLAMTFGGGRPERQILQTIPVSILSEDMVLAGPADAPSEEPASDVAAAPLEEAVEPPPPEPAPVPTPRPPEKAPAPRPDTRRAPPPPSNPPPPKKAERPRPPREESLDLGALAADRPNRSPNRGATPPSGQQATGAAGRTMGRGDLQALGSQVRPSLNCDLPGADSATVRVIVRLGLNGRIVGSLRLQGPRTPIAERVLQGIQAAQPFDMPPGYEEQDIPFVFNTSTWC